jgi:hypothetical protein
MFTNPVSTILALNLTRSQRASIFESVWVCGEHELLSRLDCVIKRMV